MNYKIKMNKDDYFKISNKIISNNLEINGEDVIFEIESGSYNILKKTNYEFKIVESINSKIKNFMHRYGLILTGFMFMLSILYINIYRVSDINFNRDTPINDEISYRIKSSFKRLLWFDFCNLDYEEFTKSLQLKYFEYPYIDVSCKNNEINVYIADVDEFTYNKIESLEGNIIAKKDAIVDIFYAYNGKCKVSKNKYVKSGDILIEGNNLVSGLVMGTTYDSIKITIPKNSREENLTSERDIYYNINILGYDFNICKDSEFVNCHSKELSFFNIFDFLCIKKIEETKKNVIIKEYDSEEALNIAKNKIYNDFEEHKINNLEKIISYTNIKTEEDEESYSFTFIVKKYESIGAYAEKE